MEALGALGPYELLQSQIQGVVGEFLSARTILTNLTRHADSAIVSEAYKLLTLQSILETELSNVNKTLDNIKAGAYTYTEVAVATASAYAITDHNRKVRNLIAKAGGVPSAFDIPWSTLGLVAAGGVVVIWLLKR